MTFRETILSPAGGPAFEPGMAGSFTGIDRDFPGPQERTQINGVLWNLPPPNVSAPCHAEHPEGLPVLLSELQPPVLPMDTALSLQALSAALAQPVTPQAAPVYFGGVSLSVLAEKLSARFVRATSAADADPEDAVDLMSTPSQPEVRSPGAITKAEWPHPASATHVETTPAVRPGMAPAACSLSKAPRAAGSKEYDDIFFPDPPAVAAFVDDTPAGAHPEDKSGGFLLLPARQSLPDKPNGTGQQPLPDWLSAVLDLPTVVSSGRPEDAPGFSSVMPADESRSFGQIIGGTGLILLGVFLACRLPLLWLALETDPGWNRQKIVAGLILQGGGAMIAFVLGCGSISQRDWAAPGIVAIGWLAVMTATLVLAVAGVLLGSDVALDFGWLEAVFLMTALLVPLAYLIFYEKHTDHHPDVPRDSSSHRVPLQATGLIIFLSGIGLAFAGAGMLQHQPALPLPTRQILTGPAAQAGWISLAAAGILIAVLAWCRHAAAWWLLLLATLGIALTVGVCGCIGGGFWQDFLKALGCPETDAVQPSLLPLCSGLSSIILVLVLAMSRRSFAPLPPA